MTSDYDGEIARRAYNIWEDEGRPSGRELDHWLRAEAEVKAERTESPTQAPKSPQRLEAVPTAAPVKPQRPAPRRARRT
ncbi:MAG TPA: DUF2934 domain-containing protein [Stellaceae bacterium]|nr:DUF2934 domain-containing protein [Stellaceae bacterium]